MKIIVEHNLPRDIQVYLMNDIRRNSNKKILICGDSFSSDWSPEYPDCQGWPNLLAKDYKVTNLSQAGCSEYRIYKQIKSKNLDNFDFV